MPLRIPNHQNRNTFNDYWNKVEILPFFGNTKIKDFLNWLAKFERFFEIIDVLKDKMVKMVVFCLKSTPGVQCDQLQNAQMKHGKSQI